MTPQPLKNPFVLAFVAGAVLLSVLPLLQRRFLRAPPPLAVLGDYSLTASDGSHVTPSTLEGRVHVVQVLPRLCTTPCLEQVEHFSRLLPHLEDLRGKVSLISLVVPDGQQPLIPEALASKARPGQWLWVSGSAEDVRRVAAVGPWQALAPDAGTRPPTVPDDAPRVAALALVDQRGAVRGFWPDDVAGRGNLINAARLLARHGPNP